MNLTSLTTAGTSFCLKRKFLLWDTFSIDFSIFIKKKRQNRTKNKKTKTNKQTNKQTKKKSQKTKTLLKGPLIVSGNGHCTASQDSYKTAN